MFTDYSFFKKNAILRSFFSHCFVYLCHTWTVLPVLPIEAKANGYAAGVPGGDLLDLGPAPTSPAPTSAPAAPAGSVDLLDM